MTGNAFIKVQLSEKAQGCSKAALYIAAPFCLTLACKGLHDLPIVQVGIDLALLRDAIRNLGRKKFELKKGSIARTYLNM